MSQVPGASQSPRPRASELASMRAHQSPSKDPTLPGSLAFSGAAGYEQSCTVFGLGSGFHHQWTLILQLLWDCNVSRSLLRGGGLQGMRENS